MSALAGQREQQCTARRSPLAVSPDGKTLYVSDKTAGCIVVLDVAAGKIRDKHDGESFYTRLMELEKEFPGAAVLIHIHGVLGQPLADLWGSRELLEVIEQILGPEIAGHPIWNLRSKTPLNPLATVPWHQDTAYLAPGAEHTLQPTTPIRGRPNHLARLV